MPNQTRSIVTRNNGHTPSIPVIISKDHEVSLFNAISKIDKKSKVFSSRTIEKLEDFKNLILSFKIYSERNNAYETANLVIHKTKLIDFYRDEGTLESMNRIENIHLCAWMNAYFTWFLLRSTRWPF